MLQLLNVNGWTMTVPINCSPSSTQQHSPSRLASAGIISRRSVAFASVAAIGWAWTAPSLSLQPAVSSAEPERESDTETLSNIPPELSGECPTPKNCRKPRIQRPKSRKAESCTSNCLTTCIYGGDGLPGQGLLLSRGPTVVFKDGFRSRRYCLVECSDICNLIKDEDYGP
ncbi:hypothetical protein SAY86_009595 [Trapa natans]|uniref:Uncharacterized protein n=1 Tax=Trapa natans TaxID=22666 RepID=A0AAN7KX51_TRANT|nr:hypothetical protein SAY86_009595 [Trapa natans]